MSSASADLLTAALAYAAQGFAVFPVHTPIGTEGGCSCQGGGVCTEPQTGKPRPKNAGKHPRTRNGVKDASSDPGQIREWWTAWPDANIGIATGEPSGFWVLDVDGPDGERALKELEFVHDDVPDTRTVSTGRAGGGRHLWFTYDEARMDLANRSRKVGASLDVRGTGGYVVAPPSLHHSGRRYSFGSDAPIVEAPTWLIERAQRRPDPQAAPNREQRTPPPQDVIADLFADRGGASDDRVRFRAAVEAAERQIAATPEGGRNEAVNAHCYSVGGLWIHWGCGDESELEAAIARLEVAARAAEQPPSMVRRAIAAGRAHPPPRPEDRPAPERPRPAPAPAQRASVLARLVELVDAGDVDAALRDAEIAALVAKPGDLAGEVEVVLLRLPHKHQAALRRVARRGARQAHRAPDADDQHREARELIRGEISRENKDGQLVVITTLGTAVTVLREDPAWRGQIRRNELSGLDHIGDRPVDADLEIEIAEAMERYYGAEWALPKVQNAIRHVGASRLYHPVRDYLDGLPEWDGVERLSRLLLDYFAVSPTSVDGADVSELQAAYGRGFLISMVARARSPGCKVDQVLVLYGPQGAGKSSGLAALVPDRSWFHDDHVPIEDDKRLGLVLRGPWLVEFAELASVQRAQIEAVKSTITRAEDRFVPMFGRQITTVPRGCVFVATVNPDSTSGRGAPEVGRRWWVSMVREDAKIDPARIAADRDQLFAEASAAYESGEPWWLSDDLDAQQREDVAAYIDTDEWSDAVARFTADWHGGELTGTELCYKVSGLELLRLSMAEQHRLGSAARAAGWRKVGGGRQGRRWRPPK